MSSDVITALILQRDALEWTTLSRRKNKWEKTAQRRLPLEVPAGARELPPEQLAARVKAIAPELKGRVAVAIPSERVLLRVAQLPSTDIAELVGMAELQVDKFSPFPVDQTSVAVEILERKDKGARVLIAAALRTLIDQTGAMLNAAGIFPREADVEIMGWWRALQDGGAVPKEGPHALLVVSGPMTELIIARDGVPLLFRALGSQHQLTAAEAATEIAGEIDYTLTTLESEWGVTTLGALTVWYGPDTPAAFLSALGSSGVGAVTSRPLSELPWLSESLARRSLARDATMLDLAPPEWRSTLQARRVRKRVLAAAATVLGAWLLGLAVFLVGLKYETSRAALMKTTVDALSGPAAEVQKLQQQVRSLKRYADRTYSGLECLREICDRLPPGVEITSFSYKKYGQVNLRGEADQADPIYEFLKKLEESKQFKEVKPEGVTTQTRSGRPRSQFKVTLILPEEGA